MSARDHVTSCDLLVRNGDCTCPRRQTALQVKAKGDRVFLHCPDSACDTTTVHSWAAGAAVTVPQVLAAETHHRNAAHPFKPSPDDLHDAVGYDGGDG